MGRALNPFAVDARVNAALVLVEARPASGAIALACRDATRAGHAADGGIAVHHQRMLGKVVLVDIAREVRQAPIHQWIETEAAIGQLDPIPGRRATGLN